MTATASTSRLESSTLKGCGLGRCKCSDDLPPQKLCTTMKGKSGKELQVTARTIFPGVQLSG